MRQVYGFSLIELLISIALGVVLSSGMITVYLESKRNYAAEQELARIQENGRFAINLLKREFSMAGFYGGYFITEDELNSVGLSDGGRDCVESGNWALNLAAPIEHINNFDNSWVTSSSTHLHGCVPKDTWVKSGSDIVTIKRTAGKATMFAGELVGVAKVENSKYYLKVKNYGEFKQWFFSDSVVADFAADFNELDEYWEFYSKIYYIRNWSVTVGDDVPVLCVRQLVRNNMFPADRCLVEGIEDMQIEFGIDSDGDHVPNRYTSELSDVSRVVTIRIFLLVRSLGELPGEKTTKTYVLGHDASEGTAMSDGYMRQLYSTTVVAHNAAGPGK
ncbi:MAG: PilW family protein [Halioglobus sp.]